MPRRIPHKYPLPVNPRCLLQAIGASLVALILFSCEEYPYPSYPPGVYPHAATSGAYPRPAPAGWWNDDDASGSAKIVVHIGEQKAYFYKGKRVVGETTVSTGKPGFSTPPGHYTVLSKDAGHVSTVFGDYVDDYGNVVRSNVDSRKDARPKGAISMARECRMRCSLEGDTRCTRAMFRPLPRRTVAFVCRDKWPSSFLKMPRLAARSQ